MLSHTLADFVVVVVVQSDYKHVFDSLAASSLVDTDHSDDNSAPRMTWISGGQ